jgi:hypothetical protein
MTIAGFGKSANNGCSLCNVFFVELDYVGIGKAIMGSHDISLVKNESLTSRVLLLRVNNKQILGLELYCDRGKDYWTLSCVSLLALNST